ncbi:uncharacterized protein LOC131641109 [Vicia villosa]|uniref:uncharacterized protein LOC131641109 n=1 Tax=Vicia villosa TaxID=3911 RepID=UPI00273B043E|nr:uncharacterized protein LOC131641109 [Vicia villosa]
MKVALSQLWKIRILTNILMFGWRFILNRLPTKDNLLERDIELAEIDEVCVLCGNYSETRNHLFTDCIFSLRIWKAIYAWLGYSKQISANDFVDFPNRFSKMNNKAVREVVYIVWLAASWTIWLSRNAVIFEDKSANLEDCITSIKFTSWNWINSGRFSSPYCRSY